jgi:hypothetical protein
MSGGVPPAPLYFFMACMGKTWPLCICSSFSSSFSSSSSSSCSSCSYSSLGAVLPLTAESVDLNDLFPFPSIMDADDPVFNPHLANILFNIILPPLLGSSL